MSQSIEDRIRKSNLIPVGSTVVLGLSGGPDSITLLYALHALQEELAIHIVPVHVNHQLRESADAEETHIREVCCALGINCCATRIDCRGIAERDGISVEEAGRNERYRIFDETCKRLEESGVPKESMVIAVAHNADDQCETVLQRIVRGTGMRGLAGIPSCRLSEAGYRIVRPLLTVPRSEIEAYVAENHLEPNQDESNQSLDYTRNRIRLELIPYLEEHFNPSVKQALMTLREIAVEEDSYMAAEARRALRDVRLDRPLNESSNEMCRGIMPDNGKQPDQLNEDSDDTLSGKGSVDSERTMMDGAQAEARNISNCCATGRVTENAVLSVPNLRAQHPAIAQRLIAELMRELGAEEELRRVHVESIRKLAESENPSRSVDLPCGLQAVRQYDRLIIRRTESKSAVAVNEMGLRVTIQNRIPESHAAHYACFDYDEFCRAHGTAYENIRIRHRMPGDCIAIGGGKHKKIQDYMVDAKIPKEIRDSLLLVAIGNDVLWVLPSRFLPTNAERNKGKFSQNYQIRATSKALLFLEIIEPL
jgi:tRNA(Ile)-lysidine synthase